MTQPHTALIVDDDVMIRGLLGTVLKRYGILCDFAENGEEAIAKLDAALCAASEATTFRPVAALPPA